MRDDRVSRLPSHQDDIERHALALIEDPRIKAAQRRGEQAFLESIDRPRAESLERFAEASREMVLSALLSAVDGHSGETQLRLIQRPPHVIDGNPFPGTRGLHDNPDTHYHIVPVDGSSHFVLDGQLADCSPTVFEISLLTQKWHTIGHISQHDLVSDEDGSFRVEVGPGPSGGPGQFVKSAPDAEMLLIRETLADWTRETPSRLRLINLPGSGIAIPSSAPAFVEDAARRVEKWFAEAIRLHAEPLARPPHDFPKPEIRNEHGMLVTMAYSIGHFCLEEEQALVLTIEPGDAGYVVVPVTNLWGTSGDPIHRSTHLNTKLASANGDGTYSFVVSLHDPGVRNWVDPEGLSQGLVFLRWANLGAAGSPQRGPDVTSALVPMSRLKATLPPETVWVDAQQRRELLDQRAQHYERRLWAS